MLLKFIIRPVIVVPTEPREFLTARLVLVVAVLVIFTSLRTMRTVEIILVQESTLHLTLETVAVLVSNCLTLAPALLQFSPRPLSTAQPRPVKFRHVPRTSLTLAFTPPVPLVTLATVTLVHPIVVLALLFRDRTRDVEKDAIADTQLPVDTFVAPHVPVVHLRSPLEDLRNKALILFISRLHLLQVLTIVPFRDIVVVVVVVI